MLPNLITLTLKVTFSDFWRYLALGLIAIYMFLPMQATPLVFACIVSGVTVAGWLVVSLLVWTAPYRCNIHIVNQSVVMVTA
jgi:hypothetical protein